MNETLDYRRPRERRRVNLTSIVVGALLGGTAVLLLAIGGTLLVSAIRRGHEATPFAAFVVMGFALLLSLLFGYGSIRLINQGLRGH